MDKMQLMEARMHAAEERIRQLEQHIHYPNDVIKNRMLDMREASVKQEALYAPLRPDTAPMRSDVETILRYNAFIRLIAWGDLQYRVDEIVVDEARKTLEGK